MTINDAFYLLKQQLGKIYLESEASAIAHMVMEELTGMSKIERLMAKELELNTSQKNSWDYIADELITGKPIQYVLGKTYFLERAFIVTENVLIPRPETEELVLWVLNDEKKEDQQKEIIDIGTGSGCIAISLKAEWPQANVLAYDLSEDAIAVAKQNAQIHNCNLQFKQQDILDKNLWNIIPKCDIIVSNPPYIPIAELDEMDENVAGHEPHQALFVPNNDPLIFYRNIAQLGKIILSPNGAVYCEIHRDFPEETKELFESEGYSQIEVRRDMHNNWRMIKATL